MAPGEEDFVRQPLPERDPERDCDTLDSNKPSIHILVDDVIMKILQYLPLKKLIHCEIVCHRWQTLLYKMFKKPTPININEYFLKQNSLYFSKAMLSKMLLLKGGILKSFSIESHFIDDTMRNKLFLIIAQLCPRLEYLNLSNEDPIMNLNNCYGEYTFDNVKALTDCKDLKSFSAENCFEINEILLKELISVLPWLEKINVSRTIIKGDCFNLLPEGLKELNISFCKHVSKENLCKVSEVCKNLEVLEIDNANDLEDLLISMSPRTENRVDFGMLTELKTVVLGATFFHKQELLSLERCRNLQYVTVMCYIYADQEIITRILKGCPEIKHIEFPHVGIDITFLINIAQLMKNRSEPIKIRVNKGDLTAEELLEAQYDTTKINFDFDVPSWSDVFNYDDDFNID